MSDEPLIQTDQGPMTLDQITAAVELSRGLRCPTCEEPFAQLESGDPATLRCENGHEWNPPEDGR